MERILSKGEQIMNADLANKMFMLVASGKSFEDSGLSAEHKEHYNKMIEEVKSAPEGAMMAPINEWVGDEYDDIIAAFERVDARNVSKRIGKYEVSKAEGEKRYTLGAMYIPDKVDAHGEWTDSDELQRAVWDYVRSDDRRIRLQHNRDVVAGEWVEVMAFPYSLTVPIQTPSGAVSNHTYPPNTVFLGVIWEPWAWELVKAGKILGYSIGGKAERLYVDMEEDMEKGDPTVSDVHVDTIMKPSKKKPKAY
jgi:Putative phage serine protease XkdF